MLRKFFYLIFGALLILPLGMRAQIDSCVIDLAGVVLAGNEEQPLSFAKVQIKELGLTTMTDAEGNFNFHNLCPGAYTVVCTHINCDHTEQEHRLAHGSIDSMVFHVDYSHLRLNEVEIVARAPEMQPPLPVSRLSGVGLDQVRGLPLGEVLSRLPGVTSLKTGATISKPVIHGMHSQRVLILNNGIRHEAQQWGSEHAPEIDPLIARDIQVVKGANSVRYGSDALGGVILVNPGPLPDSQGVHGEFHLQGNSNGRGMLASGLIESRLHPSLPLAARVQGTFKRAGNLQTPDYFLHNTGVEEINGSAALAYDGLRVGGEVFYSHFESRIGILDAAHIGNLTDLEKAINSEVPIQKGDSFTYRILPPYQDLTHQLFKARGYFHTGDHSKIEFTYAWQRNQRDEYDKHRRSNSQASYQFDLHTHIVEGVWKSQLFPGFQSTLGGSWMYQENRMLSGNFIPNFYATNLAGFWIGQWRRGKWQVEGGLRFDQRYIISTRREAARVITSEATFERASATLGASYQINRHLRLAANAGTAWRPPHVSELYSNGLHHGSAAVEIGDSTLNSEQALNFSLDLQMIDWGPVSGSISLYHNEIADFIFLQPDTMPTLTIRGAFPTFRYTQTRARITGADIDLQVAIAPQWQAEANLSWLLGQNVSEDKPLIFMPANRGGVALRFTQNRRFLRGAWVRLGVQHVARQNRAPVDEDYTPPPPAYTLTTLEAGLPVPLAVGQLDFGLRIDNLFDVRYRDYLNRFRYFADELGRNINVRVKWTF